MNPSRPWFLSEKAWIVKRRLLNVSRRNGPEVFEFLASQVSGPVHRA